MNYESGCLNSSCVLRRLFKRTLLDPNAYLQSVGDEQMEQEIPTNRYEFQQSMVLEKGYEGTGW